MTGRTLRNVHITPQHCTSLHITSRDVTALHTTSPNITAPNFIALHFTTQHTPPRGNARRGIGITARHNTLRRSTAQHDTPHNSTTVCRQGRTMTELKAIPERSPETRLLIIPLERLELGGVATYADLSKAGGCNVQDQGRGKLGTAMRAVERERGFVLCTVRNVGVKRMRPEELPSVAEHATTHIRRHSLRNAKRMERAAETEVLDPDTRRRLFAFTSVMRMLSHVSSRKSIAKVESAIENGQTGTLPVAKTLGLFGIRGRNRP